jgi:hypothetical protein
MFLLMMVTGNPVMASICAGVNNCKPEISSSRVIPGAA